MLLRLAYLSVTNMFAALRLLPMSDHCKDAEILALRHQLTVLRWHRDLINGATPARADRRSPDGRPQSAQSAC
ncbi:hypothetical protein AB0E78_08205 [Streptomyces sp. NPDC032198]|uniref:hypothetical protein n=1 Tax=Streptomyces sp. NPDC032198 TaxID=3155127 RepID=UPI0033D07254